VAPGKGYAVDIRQTGQTNRWLSSTRYGCRMRPLESPEDAPSNRQTALPHAARVCIAAEDDRYVLVEVAGEIDILSRQELAEVLSRAVDGGTPAVIVDLSAVTLLSAAGFHCLQHAEDQLARRRGRLHVVCPAGGLADRILRLFDPNGRWPRFPDAQAAVACGAGHPSDSR
jgi:anti-anti-sigma factor